MLRSFLAVSRGNTTSLVSKRIPNLTRNIRSFSTTTTNVNNNFVQQDRARGLLASFGLVVLATTAVTSVSTKREVPTATPLESQSQTTHRTAGVYLIESSKKDFLSTFPPTFVEGVETTHAAVAVNPVGAKLSAIATDLGRPVQLRVTGIAKNEDLEVALVELVYMGENDDGGVPVAFEYAHPHIVVSTKKGEKHVDASRFLERLAAASSDDSLKKDFEGELPETEDGLKPSKASLMVLRHPYTLHATLCISDLWLHEDSKCGERTCGFCRFMKLGPCGKEFEAWEACIDKCKETEEDFVTKCMEQTLALKTCVDENEDYYAVPSKKREPVEEEKPTAEP